MSKVISFPEFSNPALAVVEKLNSMSKDIDQIVTIVRDKDGQYMVAMSEFDIELLSTATATLNAEITFEYITGSQRHEI